MSYEELPDFVVCAALHYPNGVIVCGARHFDDAMQSQIRFMPYCGKPVQGFLNSRSEFISREHALALATQREQIRRRVGGDQHGLYSENLY